MIINWIQTVVPKFDSNHSPAIKLITIVGYAFRVESDTHFQNVGQIVVTDPDSEEVELHFFDE